MQTHTFSGDKCMRKAAYQSGLTFLVLTWLLHGSDLAQQPNLYCRIDETITQKSLGAQLVLLSDLNEDGVRELVAKGNPYYRILDGVTGEVLREHTNLFVADYANAGDVDGDGIDDLLMGMPTTAGGSAWIASGATGEFLIGTFATTSGSNYGLSVDGVGDLNGDGTPDFAVGASGDHAGVGASGSVTVYSGADGQTLWKYLGTDTYQGWSNLQGALVAGVGDQDLDGIPDLVVGPAHQPSNCPVLSGLSGEELFTLVPVSGAEFEVKSLARLGDLDLDGISEIALGVPEAPDAGASAGVVDVFAGGSGVVQARLFGEAIKERFGHHVSGEVDLDGDGVSEIAAAVEPCLTSVCPGFGRVRVYSGATSAKLFDLVSTSKLEAFGCSIELLGDVNGDGIGEFAVGACGDNLGINNAGKVLIYSATSGAALIADKAFVKPLVGGGTVQMKLQSGRAHAGELFVLLSSSSGNAPGVVLGDQYLPLVPDNFTLLALTPGAVPLTPIAGVVAASGTNSAQLVIPPGLANGLSGVTLTQAYLLFDPQTLAITKASNSVPVTLLKN